jgi:predicted nuclease of predicted toxin-antitoxin system
MKIPANENFPLVAVEALREVGHDVLWARTDMPGEADRGILRRAQEEGRLVVTFDKDFGELAFHTGLPAECGVILFRVGVQSPEYVRDHVLEILRSTSDWQGRFAVAEPDRIRMRPLPGAPTHPPSAES